MAEQPDNPILVYLHRIDGKIDRLGDDVRDLKNRLAGVEEAVVGVHRRVDRLQLSIGRVENRLSRIERHRALMDISK